MDFMRENFAIIVAWVPLVFIALIVIGIAIIWLLSRKNRPLISKRWVHKLVSSLSLMMVAFSVMGLFLLHGPLSPLTKTAGRLRGNVGEPFPEVKFRLVKNDSVLNLHEFAGKVVLLNFWATWCPPCLAEIPTLNRLQTDYRDRGLLVVALSDERRESLLPFVDKYSPDIIPGYVQALDWLPMQSFRPFTVVIDRRGVLQKYMFGAQKYEVFEEAIRPHL